ncbi:MAG: glycosyltransferase [Iphinoe sp. HA4291-MV1]|jgi:glycosyltransferase involved in cell wall biosynthesis|nr:glycosyltransferase [Iphinoe sp. HA4291-MV1]
MPTVSVIIPTYQRAHLLSEAINSVLAQTYKDYEIIVINDGSSDNTTEVLAQFGDCPKGSGLKPNRITAIHQSHRGVSAARNAGIKASNGQYIAFLDDDDLWETQKLELQIPVLESHPEIGLIYSDVLWFNEQGFLPGSYNNKFPTPNVQAVWTLFINNFIPTISVVVRRECFDEIGFFDENLTACEDYDLWLRLIEKWRVYFLNESLARCQISENSIQKDIKRVLRNYLCVKEKAISRHSELRRIPLKFLDAWFYDYYLKLARVYLENYQSEKARIVLHRYREARGETPAYNQLDQRLNSASTTNELRDSRCVFVVAQGRSGSTLLLRLLNEIEGYNICGENFAAISQLSTFYQSLIKATKTISHHQGNFFTYEELLSFPKQTNSTYSRFEWYNVYNIEDIKEKLRELIVQLYNPERKFRVWGFKEIRFGMNISFERSHNNLLDQEISSYETFQRDLDFLKEVFPNCKFIFHTRRIQELVKSAWWAKNPQKSQEILKEQERFFAEYSHENAEFSYYLTYDDLVNNTHTLQGMYKFLGEAFDIDKYKAVLSR